MCSEDELPLISVVLREDHFTVRVLDVNVHTNTFLVLELFSLLVIYLYFVLT